MPSLLKKHPIAVILSVAIHLVLIIFLVFGLDLVDTAPVKVEPVNTVKATVIDGAKIKAEADRLKKLEQKKKRNEQKRLDELKKKRLLEEKKIKDLQKRKIAEQKAIEKQKVAEAARLAKIKQQKKKIAAEAKKKAAADKKKKIAAEKQKKAEKNKREKAKKLADEKKKKLADKKRREKEEKLAAEKQRKQEDAERERDFLEAMAREEEEERAQEALASFSGAIKQKVQQNWIQPAGGLQNFTCIVQVKLIPGGEVIDAQVIKSSGNALFDRSVELATRKASPLPLPEDPSLFKYFRTIEFKFDPQVN